MRRIIGLAALGLLMAIGACKKADEQAMPEQTMPPAATEGAPTEAAPAAPAETPAQGQ